MRTLPYLLGLRLLFALVLLVVAFDMLHAETPLHRQLARAWIIHCSAENDPAPLVIVSPVELPNGSIVDPQVRIEGELPPTRVGCIFLDSYADRLEVEGELMLWRQGEGPIQSVLYTALIRDGRRSYAIADWAEPTHWTADGAAYDMRSALVHREDGSPLTYRLALLRNGADETQAHTLAGERVMIANVDPATIMRVTRTIEDSVVYFDLDYRAEP